MYHVVVIVVNPYGYCQLDDLQSVSNNIALSLPLYFLNNSMKNRPTLIIFGILYPEET